MRTFEEKQEALEALIDNYARQDLMVAFSGGVDSSLLLSIACRQAKKYGSNVYAITIHTALHPMGEAKEARREAEQMGAVPHTIQVDELSGAGIEDNPEDRCYRCKRYMFQKVQQLSEQLSVKTIIEGTNADDLGQYRPGIRAIRELGLKSPLVEAEFTKADVRHLAARYGIAASKKPSTPCLATRFPYGTRLSYEEMRKVEAMEEALRSRGYYNVRARIHGDLVRLEVDVPEIARLINEREWLVELVKSQGYSYVSADLEGFRSGSQDLHIMER